MIAEYDAAGNITRRHVPSTGNDDPIVSYGPQGRSWLYADERGSVVSTADDAGNASQIMTYDESGIPGGSYASRFQYTGQAWLPELGMAYYKARIYSPTLGRFLQPDPIGYQDGLNLYSYGKSDPVNKTDSTGLLVDDIVVTGRRLRQDGGFGGFNFWSFPTFGGASFNFGGGQNNDIIVTGQRPSPPPTDDDEIVVTAVRPSRDRILVDAAEEAAQSIPPFFNSLLGRTVFGWLRGIIIHNRFAAIIRAMNNPAYNAEVSYLRGKIVPYGTPGLSRVDAVVGNPASPLFVIDLKTGAAILDGSQLNAYRANVPPTALIQQILLP